MMIDLQGRETKKNLVDFELNKNFGGKMKKMSLQGFCLVCNNRDHRPYAKMAAILMFFCLHSNQLYQPRSRVKLSKEYFTTNEASRTDLNVDKRILKLPPYWHRVYFANNRDHYHLTQRLGARLGIGVGGIHPLS